MANLTKEPVVIKELQVGVCRESDIHRYGIDLYGRQTEISYESKILASVALFDQILKEMVDKD
jgi:hypothetical protein